jgi:hypothetical protein
MLLTTNLSIPKSLGNLTATLVQSPGIRGVRPPAASTLASLAIA